MVETFNTGAKRVLSSALQRQAAQAQVRSCRIVPLTAESPLAEAAQSPSRAHKRCSTQPAANELSASGK